MLSLALSVALAPHGIPSSRQSTPCASVETASHHSSTTTGAERALRGFALGRKSWLFAGSDRSADRAALMATLIMSAKLNDIFSQVRLADVLTRIATPTTTLEQRCRGAEHSPPSTPREAFTVNLPNSSTLTGIHSISSVYYLGHRLRRSRRRQITGLLSSFCFHINL